MCISQLLNKFSGARSYQHFSCSVYPLTTVLIFAVRRITPRNLLDILRARKQNSAKRRRDGKRGEERLRKIKERPDAGSTVILKSRTIVNLNSRALFLTLRRTYRRRHGENASAPPRRSRVHQRGVLLMRTANWIRFIARNACFSARYCSITHIIRDLELFCFGMIYFPIITFVFSSSRKRRITFEHKLLTFSCHFIVSSLVHFLNNS